MKASILLVDDEPSVLAGYERTLHHDFVVHTALSGHLGLAALRTGEPFAVVISDMRMPIMNGAQFLAQAKQIAPDTVRMLLTGYTDLDAAMAAINEGNIFRFLAKPCTKEVLTATLHAGLVQHDLIRAEKDLLETTLLGSIKALANVLSASSPEAFGRSIRIAHVVRHIAASFRFEQGWRLEAAAMLSQLGCVMLDTDIIQQAFIGMKLSLEDQTQFDSHPLATGKLLAGIPRLEPVAWMIEQQFAIDISGIALPLGLEGAAEIIRGAKILKLAVAYDDLRIKPLSSEVAIERLRGRSHEFEDDLLNALEGIGPQGGARMSRRLAVPQLSTGMLLDQDVRDPAGLLLAVKGQEISQALLLKMQTWAPVFLIGQKFNVTVSIDSSPSLNAHGIHSTCTPALSPSTNETRRAS